MALKDKMEIRKNSEVFTGFTQLLIRFCKYSCSEAQ